MKTVKTLLFASLLATVSVFAQPAAHVEIVPVRGHIYMLAGAGGNITVSIGPDGVLLVDSGLAQMSGQVLAAIDQLRQRVTANGANGAPAKPIRYILIPTCIRII